MADLRSASSVEEALKMLDDKIAALDRKKRAALELSSWTATTDSATWSSTTKVLTNLVGSFTAVKGLTYRAHAEFCWTSASPNLDAFGIGWTQGGAATAASTMPSPKAMYCPIATGIVVSKISTKFTATADGTIGLGVIGYKPTADTALSRLKGAAYMVNELWVEIVA